MKLIKGNKEVKVNTMSNWPLIEDLFIKWGYTDVKPDVELKVTDIENVTSELSAWGIPWKQTKWEQ